MSTGVHRGQPVSTGLAVNLAVNLVGLVIRHILKPVHPHALVIDDIFAADA